MRDATRESADRVHLLRVAQSFFSLFTSGNSFLELAIGRARFLDVAVATIQLYKIGESPAQWL